MTLLGLAAIIVSGYLLGSIPFGYLLTLYAGFGDIRSIGSGNIGATNVLRTGNKKLAALTLLLDCAKGYAAVVLANYMTPELDYIAALAALIGHMYPVWLKFKGGKGVATFVGSVLALSWPVGLATMLIWILVAKISRYSSLAALVAIAVAPFGFMFFGQVDLFCLVLVMAIMVILKHRANIHRLLTKTEPKIGAPKDAVPSAE